MQLIKYADGLITGVLMELVFYNLRVICIYNFLEGLFFLIGLNLWFNKKCSNHDIIYGFILGLLFYIVEITYEQTMTLIPVLISQNIQTIIYTIIFQMLIMIYYKILNLTYSFKRLFFPTFILLLIYNINIDLLVGVACYITKQSIIENLNSYVGELFLQIGTKILQYLSLLIYYLFRRHINEQTKQNVN